MKRRHLLPVAGCFLTVLAYGCSEEGLTQPDRSILPSDNGETLALSMESIRLTAAELLADPLLHDMLDALRDERRASAITAAVDATYESLAQDDIDTARKSLDDACGALDRYQDGRDVDDEDVIHLDASERFLDEVEAMIDLDVPDKRDRKKPKNQTI